MSNWGDDYSLLIHSIEGHLSEHIAASPMLDQSRTSNQSTPGLKRRRLSSDSSSYFAQSDEMEQYSFANRSTDYQNADVMKLTAQVDETRLLNERLKEKYDGVVDEFAKYKIKTMKHLQFMVTENNQLKKDTAGQSDRYYDEKQKWQSSLRAAESEIAKLSRRVTSASQSPAVLARAPAGPGLGFDNKLSELEISVHQKTNDMKMLSLANAELEERCGKLQQDLLLTKLKLGEQVQAEDDVSETRDFRKRCADLETSLRRKTREFDRLEGKIQNQLLLEEELATANMKLKIAQDSIEKSKVVGTLYHALLDEKREWSTLFQGIISENENLSLLGTLSELKSNTRQISSQDTNPAVVLRTLGSIQKRYVLLLKSQSEFEASNIELRKKLEEREASLATLGIEKDDVAFQAERAVSRLRLAQRQAKLFEGEVSSLRALLSSFDVEFSMGRPDAAKLFLMKDQTISSLQKELDAVRAEASAISEHADVLELKLQNERSAALAGPADVAVAEGGVDGLENHRHSVSSLLDELVALQAFTGVDFVPGKTKVLHFIQNPSHHALGSRAAGASSLPKDMVRRLQREASGRAETEGNVEGAGGEGGQKEDGPLIPSGNVAAPSAVASADSNKMNQRLKELFKERITSFRECVYLLTGYKVDLHTADTAGGYARLRLRSMYAEDPEDSLLFQMKGDCLELIETPFVGKLNPAFFTYLNTCNSVPAFLSSITMDLFDNQTLLGA